MKNKVFGFSALNALFKQVFSFWKYKRCYLPFAILLGILMAPYFIAFVALLGVLYVISTIIYIVDAPCSYLLNFVHNEKEGVKHATEAVIYFVCLPFIYLLKIINALQMFVGVVIYFLALCFGAVASLGGVEFKVDFINPIRRKIPAYDGKKYSLKTQAFCVTLGLAIYIVLGTVPSIGGILFAGIIASVLELFAPIPFQMKYAREPKKYNIKHNLGIIFVCIAANVLFIGMLRVWILSSGVIVLIANLVAALAAAWLFAVCIVCFTKKKPSLLHSIFVLSAALLVVGATALVVVRNLTIYQSKDYTVLPYIISMICEYAIMGIASGFSIASGLLFLFEFLKSLPKKEKVVEEIVDIKDPANSEEEKMEQTVVDMLGNTLVGRMATLLTDMPGHAKGEQGKIINADDQQYCIEFEDGTSIYVIVECARID